MGNVSALPALPAIPSQIGRYSIVCELGQGGMGTIYLGRAEGIGGFERLMAIKMIHPHLSRQQSFINMFLDEARIAALIRHPNVVPVYEIGEHEGRHFIAMDYVSGEPLSILLDNTWCRGIPLDVDVVAYVVSVVCEALHAAHDLKDPTGRPLHVVHRDVCPQNIMLGYDGVTRVMDFGVAKAVDQLSQTRPGTHKGKVPYMAPEQIRCQGIDRRSDIFSLGVVLWESTIGKRLFKGENDILSASKVLKGKVPRPRRARENYPPELEAIVLKALNPSPEKRFQTAREMGHALREYLAHRASLIAPSDVEGLLKTICKARYERRTDIERRAAHAGPEAWPIEEETIQLFAAGESNLPNFEIESALQPLEHANVALKSSVSTRAVYEYDEELDDATVRTELEEIGFLATAEFDLLDEDRDAPVTVVGAPDGDQLTAKHDNSAVRRLIEESNQATQDVDPAEAPPIELAPEFILGPPEETMRDGGSRGWLLIAGGLAAVVIVAVALASSLDEEPTPSAPVIQETKTIAAPEPPPPPPAPVKKAIDLPPPPAVVTKPPPKIETPKPPPEPEPVKKEEIIAEEPVKEVVEETPPVESAPIVLDAEIDDNDRRIAKRAKKKKRDRREPRPRSEKRRSTTKQERLLVEPGDL